MKKALQALSLSTLGLMMLLAHPGSAEEPVEEFATANAAWRAWRIERLTSETSWLTLIGLHWLQEGDNRLGSGEGFELPLPAGKAPAKAGVLRLADGVVTLIPEAGVALTVDGEPITAPLALGKDTDEKTTLLELGSLNFYVISRGDRLGLRVRDRQAKLRLEFPGLTYFPASPGYRVEARFTPNPEGTTVRVANVLGQVEEMPSPGKITLSLDGAEHTITALDDTGDGRLYLIVGDQTNSLETYGAGRFGYTDPPADGKVIVDFNRLYNPPCAFTEFSTCQLPPRENRLPVRIEAGELKFTAPGHS